MTRQPFGACEYVCDRCGFKAELRDNKAPWAVLHPPQRETRGLDICPTCYTELEAWWDRGAVAIMRRVAVTDNEQDKRAFYERATEKVDLDPWVSALNLTIEDLYLTIRIENVLKNLNALCVGDIIQLTEEELLSQKNFGSKSLFELKEALALKGLRLGMLKLTDDQTQQVSNGAPSQL